MVERRERSGGVCSLRLADGEAWLQAVSFGRNGDAPPAGAQIDAVYRLKRRQWAGLVSAEAELLDWRPSDSSAVELRGAALPASADSWPLPIICFTSQEARGREGRRNRSLNTVNLDAEPRKIVGKQVRQLRRQGLVPANIYGASQASTPVQLGEKLVFTRVSRASRSTLYSLALDGSKQTVIVKEIQRHPTSGQVLHVDFQRVNMAEKLRVAVPLHFVGEPPAVKQLKGTLLNNLTAIEVEALPGDLPSGIEVDLSGLETFEDALHVSALVLPPNVEVITPPDELVSRVSPPAVETEVEAAPAEEAAEGEAEPAAEAEGEATTAEAGESA